MPVILYLTIRVTVEVYHFLYEVPELWELNAFTTGNPFWGQIYFEVNIGDPGYDRGVPFGALNFMARSHSRE